MRLACWINEATDTHSECVTLLVFRYNNGFALVPQYCFHLHMHVLLIYYIGIWLHILIYIQQDEMLHSLFYMETALHVSGGTTTHHQERKQLYLQHLVFVTPLLLPAAIVEELELF